MQQNNRTNAKTFLRETIAYDPQNICKMSFGLTDVICDTPFNDSFKEKLGKVQYSATLTIMGAIKGTSRLLGNVCIKNLVLNLIAVKVVP